MSGEPIDPIENNKVLYDYQIQFLKCTKQWPTISELRERTKKCLVKKLEKLNKIDDINETIEDQCIKFLKHSQQWPTVGEFAKMSKDSICKRVMKFAQAEDQCAHILEHTKDWPAFAEIGKAATSCTEK